MKKPTKSDLIKKLKDIGITESETDLDLFYHANDGWYLHCDQCNHEWIGQNLKHCIDQIKGGFLNYLTES